MPQLGNDIRASSARQFGEKVVIVHRFHERAVPRLPAGPSMDEGAALLKYAQTVEAHRIETLEDVAILAVPRRSRVSRDTCTA